MNFLAKCLIFFLNILLVQSSPAAPEAGATSRRMEALRSPKKTSKANKQGPYSTGTLRVSVTWQVVGSTGKVATMGTTSETYSANGLLFQSSAEAWRLKIGDSEIPVSFTLGSSGVDSFLMAERADLLKVLGIELSEEDRMSLAEGPEQTRSFLTEGVRLTIGRLPSRQMETIYRSPGEGLFLVKGSLNF